MKIVARTTVVIEYDDGHVIRLEPVQAEKPADRDAGPMQIGRAVHEAMRLNELDALELLRRLEPES